MTRSRFLRGDLWHLLAGCNTEMSAAQLAKLMGFTKASTSKLITRLVETDHILTNGKGQANRRYRVNPKAGPPEDQRPALSGKVRPSRAKVEITGYDTTPPWLYAHWQYFPRGLEAQYCARLDALSPKMRPEFTDEHSAA